VEKNTSTILRMFGGLISMDELKLGLKNNNLIIGTKRTIKAIRTGEVSKVFMASNCPDMLAEDVEHYCGLTDIPIEKLEADCNELGSVCKKPFFVSVVGIAKV
jgi:large subunit ribosomal protein L30e